MHLISSLMAVLVTAIPVITQADRDRTAELVSHLSLEQKCLLITGQEDGFHTAELPGIPSVRMADGPQGVRNKTNSTYYPCGLSLAASFNREVAKGVGTGIGDDASARGVRIMLCPGVNIYRSALCGRNFEYYGEDPYLASETAVNYIEGIQSRRVVATIKHFAVNNQEYDRHATSSAIDERTLHEIYLPTFRKAIEQAHVGAVMTSYNPVNGVHAAEDPYLIGLLRKWGHEGIVMSDWISTYTSIGAAWSGLDLEMPKNLVFNYEAISELVANGVIEESVIDEKCRHILQVFSAYGLLDEPMKDESIPEDYAVSREKAYAAALEGPVLLKNEGVLPIKPARKGNVVLIGPNADVVAYGGGSGKMSPFEHRSISLWKAMSSLGKGYKVILEDWKNYDEKVISDARVVIVAAGFNSKSEGEGHDREYNLPDGQDEFIAGIADLNPNTVVVINSGGEVGITAWADKVPAIMMAWYSGQEGGTALAALLTGQESPSGKLPFTFWGSLEANPANASYARTTPAAHERYKDRDPYPYTGYKEGIFLGYRGVDHFGVKPLHPFGFGLGYSSFEYSALELTTAGDDVIVSFIIKNTGKVRAREAAQVYVAPETPSMMRPSRELKGFCKVNLEKGASEKVTLTLPRSAFSYYSIAEHDWVFDPGKYDILVGASSEDIRLKGVVSL